MMHPSCFSKKNIGTKSLQCLSCSEVFECNGSSKIKHPVLDVPAEVKVELLTKCNLDCRFCFNPDNNNPGPSLKDAFRIIDNTSKSKIKAIRFTGGEPFLRKDLLDIVKNAKSKKLYVILNTNGLAVNLDVFNYVDEVLISVHDFKKIDAKLKLIKQLLKMKIRVKCCTIATPENIENLEDYYKLFSELKVTWFLLRPVPTYKNKKPLTGNELATLVEKLILLNKKYEMDVTVNNAVPYCAYEIKKTRQAFVGGCNDDGRTLIVVDANSRIRPSYFIEKKLGDARKDSLYAAWNSEAMHQLRKLELVPDFCKKCIYLNECMAGLRYAAKLVNGSFLELDPLANPEQWLEAKFLSK